MIYEIKQYIIMVTGMGMVMNKTIIIINLAEYRLILANLVYGLFG